MPPANPPSIPSPPGPEQAFSEQRGVPRGPSGSSFVPGLVHEMRNFVFGISGSLDALHARFGQQEEIAKYEAVMRASLDRFSGFMEELSDYGDPKAPSWTSRDLASLLREALEHHRPRAAQAGVELRLELVSPLPPIRADGESLRLAFIHLLGVVLAIPGGPRRLVLHAAPGGRDGAPAIDGFLDAPGLALPDVDLARLFEPFYFRVAGLGRLAMPVARRILERHGGTLRAVSGLRGGVRLDFTLPADPAGQPAPSPAGPPAPSSGRRP